MPEEEGREKLAEVIRQWNANRLDLFEISQPDENLEFHGVMRFYFEDQVGGNVATKCLRVGSNSSTRDVIETLSEKFRPDMKMLTTSYFLYEIHASKERRLGLEERPLVLQLNWTTDSREGRFVLKKGGLEGNCREKEKGGVIQHFKRTLSRKEKKKNKATHKESEEDYGLSEKQQQQSSSVRESKQEEEENNKQGVNLAGRVKPDFSDKPGLPIRVTFSDNTEDAFLSAVINYTNSSTVHFKLSPAYILYAAARFALQRQRSRGSPPHSVALTANKMVAMTRGVIQRQQASAGALAFWMANASELLNFLQQDEDVGPLTRQSQLGLSHLVHRAYSYLLQCLQNELRKHLPTFLIDPEHHGPLPAGIERVLNTLMNCMSLLRRCRVNPALTIQLFSQLFHFISAWLFNRLMGPEADSPGLRSHYWGAALRQRLMAIEAWAERQGLELAADCHLGHIVQATTLLTMNKYSTSDASNIQKSCFKLNSLQMQALLAGYLCATNEPRIPPGLMDAVVAAAEASADNLIRSEGRDMKLEESLDLRLPFLLPEGGYSCDGVRGIPPGFREFLEPICFRGLCSLTSQPNSSGDWTVFFGELSSSSSSSAGRTYWAAEPETETITLNKPLNSGMGVSIVAAKGVGQSYLGIYIKSIVGGGPAEMNGRLTAGDQLLSVDGQSLVGLSQERAAALMMQTGPVVTLQVAKSGASYHGLSALLSHQTPGPTEAGDESRSNGRAPLLYSVLDPGPSEKLHGRRKQEQIMQRNRQLYRSNPNMTTGFGPEGGDEPVVRRNHMAAVSSINLCADAFHREYLTLPTPKSQDKKLSEPSRPLQTFKVALSPSDGPSSSRRSSMRQALSQDNLSLDSERPLLDRRKNSWDQHANQSTSLYGSFPIRSSVSTRDILSDPSRPTKPQEAGPRCGAGVWRTPFSQPPTPSIQPIRIDIPVTRAASAQKNPPLTTFQSRTLNGNKPQNQTSPDYLTAATKKIPPQQPGSTRNQPVKPQVSITPTKHVSFQEPPAAQKRSSGPVKQRDPDPWKREAQEKQEEQQRLQAVKLLEQEVQELQTKAKPTAEESDRLRRLSLEWQFQKRLKEIQQGGSDDDDDDDEEEEDLEMMLTLKQLEARTKNRRSSPGGNETENPAGSLHLPQQRDEAKTDLRPGERTEDVKDIKAFKEANEKIKRAPDPENLTFKERQRLFSA